MHDDERMVTLATKVPRDVGERVRRLAAEDDRTPSWVIRRALVAYLAFNAPTDREPDRAP